MDPAYYHGSISIKLWPPSQNTRSMLVERMIKNLTTPSKSVLSRKYGLLDKKEAEEISKKIEALAYASANLHFGKKPDGDGSSAVQLYAKEASKLMLEAVKRGPLMGKEDGIVITEKSTTRDTVFDISEGRRALINEEEAKELKDEGAIQIAKALEQGCVELNEVDLSTNLIRRAGARVLAQAVIAKPGFELLNINANIISDEGVDEIKDMFKSSPAVLSSLDDNDPKGEDYDEEAEETGDEDELESKLKDLEIKHAD